MGAHAARCGRPGCAPSGGTRTENSHSERPLHIRRFKNAKEGIPGLPPVASGRLFARASGLVPAVGGDLSKGQCGGATRGSGSGWLEGDAVVRRTEAQDLRIAGLYRERERLGGRRQWRLSALDSGFLRNAEYDAVDESGRWKDRSSGRMASEG